METEPEPTNIFARLEVHGGAQLLMVIEQQTDEGCLKMYCRRDGDVIMEIRTGRWEDNTQGWADAEDALRKADMAEIALDMDRTFEAMLPKTSSEDIMQQMEEESDGFTG